MKNKAWNLEELEEMGPALRSEIIASGNVAPAVVRILGLKGRPRSKKDREPRNCILCQAVHYRRSLYCGNNCASKVWHAEHRQYSQRKVKPILTKTCKRCGAEFTTKRELQGYCSAICFHTAKLEELAKNNVSL